MSGTNQEEIVDQMVDADGQSATSPDNSEKEPVSNQPEYVSKADFEAALEKQRREFQSLADKTSSRLDKRVSDALENIEAVIKHTKAAGIQITAEQERTMRNNALDEALLQRDANQNPQGNGSAQNQTRANQVDPATAAAIRMFEEAGITLTPDDPEFSMVNVMAKTATEYLKSVDKAIEAYQTRTSKPKSSAAAPSALGKGNSGANPEAIINELNKLLQHPTPQNLPKIKELKEKLQKLET